MVVHIQHYCDKGDAVTNMSAQPGYQGKEKKVQQQLLM